MKLRPFKRIAAWGFLLWLGIVAGAVVIGVAGKLGLKLFSKAQDVKLRDEQEKRPTNAPPWLVSAQITVPPDEAIVAVPIHASSPGHVMAAKRALTFSSTNMTEWVPIDDGRDLWTIAREAAKSGKPVEFFYRTR